MAFRVGNLIWRRTFASAPQGPSAVAGDHAGGYKLWNRLIYLVALPGIAICMVNAYIAETEHPVEPPPFIPYDHLRKRRKKFPWGDGNHGLFHNPHMNALPSGYEHQDH